MATCLRSAAGFYNGGGVTPQPTPVPTTDLATYREIEWYGSTVKALCDVYGRLFTRYDSANDVYNGVAWTDEGLDKTFDSIEEHADAFLGLIQTYGHNDAVTGEGVDNVVINLGGTSTEFSFTDGLCVPVPSLWQQGAVRTLFYRTLNDGTNDINVLCDTDGKLVIGDGENPSYFGYNVASDQIAEQTANRDALIAAAGGSVVADIFSDNDGNYLLVSLDDYTVVADLDGIVTQGDITEWPTPAPTFSRKLSNDNWLLCDIDGTILAKESVGSEVEVLYVSNDNIETATGWSKKDLDSTEIDGWYEVDSWVEEAGQFTGYVMAYNIINCQPPKDGAIIE